MVKIIWQYWALLCMNFQLTSYIDWRIHWYEININLGFGTFGGCLNCVSVYLFPIWMQKWRHTWFWGWNIMISLILKEKTNITLGKSKDHSIFNCCNIWEINWCQKNWCQNMLIQMCMAMVLFWIICFRKM